MFHYQDKDTIEDEPMTSMFFSLILKVLESSVGH